MASMNKHKPIKVGSRVRVTAAGFDVSGRIGTITEKQRGAKFEYEVTFERHVERRFNREELELVNP